MYFNIQFNRIISTVFNRICSWTHRKSVTFLLLLLLCDTFFLLKFQFRFFLLYMTLVVFLSSLLFSVLNISIHIFCPLQMATNAHSSTCLWCTQPLNGVLSGSICSQQHAICNRCTINRETVQSKCPCCWYNNGLELFSSQNLCSSN